MAGFVGELRIVDKSVLRVVGAAGQLDKGAPLKRSPSGGPRFPGRRANRRDRKHGRWARSIEAALAFTQRQERCRFGANAGERHQDHRLVGALRDKQGIQHQRKIRFDIGARDVWKYSKAPRKPRGIQWLA